MSSPLELPDAGIDGHGLDLGLTILSVLQLEGKGRKGALLNSSSHIRCLKPLYHPAE